MTWHQLEPELLEDLTEQWQLECGMDSCVRYFSTRIERDGRSDTRLKAEGAFKNEISFISRLAIAQVLTFLNEKKKAGVRRTVSSDSDQRLNLSYMGTFRS